MPEQPAPLGAAVRRPRAAGCRRWQSTRITSDRVMMNVFSVLKSRTSTAGLTELIIVDSSSTGVEMSTNGNAGCMIVSTC
jgi:hypothetical protein